MNEVYIRSQDKEKLVTFDTSSFIRYAGQKYYVNNEDERVHHEIRIYVDDWWTIAEYETKERCLEVLDEIQAVCGCLYAHSTVGSEVMPPIAAIPCVYQMPEK